MIIALRSLKYEGLILPSMIHTATVESTTPPASSKFVVLPELLLACPSELTFLPPSPFSLRLRPSLNSASSARNGSATPEGRLRLPTSSTTSSEPSTRKSSSTPNRLSERRRPNATTAAARTSSCLDSSLLRAIPSSFCSVGTSSLPRLDAIGRTEEGPSAHCASLFVSRPLP
jgi:hypothetical protein